MTTDTRPNDLRVSVRDTDLHRTIDELMVGVLAIAPELRGPKFALHLWALQQMGSVARRAGHLAVLLDELLITLPDNEATSVAAKDLVKAVAALRQSLEAPAPTGAPDRPVNGSEPPPAPPAPPA